VRPVVERMAKDLRCNRQEMWKLRKMMFETVIVSSMEIGTQNVHKGQRGRETMHRWLFKKKSNDLILQGWKEVNLAIEFENDDNDNDNDLILSWRMKDGNFKGSGNRN
jgi:hypothetical protein